MGRPKNDVQTRLMRVPDSFYFQTKKFTEKYNYSNNIEFINQETVPLLDRIDLLSNLTTNIFKKRKRK